MHHFITRPISILFSVMNQTNKKQNQNRKEDIPKCILIKDLKLKLNDENISQHKYHAKKTQY